MRFARTVWFAVLFVLLAGSAVTALARPIQTGAAKMAPAAAPTPPFANGDSFQYSFTDTTVDTYPSAPPTTSTTTGNQTDVVAYPVKFGGKSDVFKVTTTAQDTSDQYGYVVHDFAGFVPDGSVYALEYYAGDETILDNGQRIGDYKFANAAPYDIAAEYPESPGLSWPSNYTQTAAESEDVGSGITFSYKQTVEADGAYKELEGTKGPSFDFVDKYELKSNGTGTLTSSATGSPTQKWTFGLPFDQDGNEVIPVATDGTKTYVPDWFPGGGAPLKPLQNYTTTIESFAATPQTCGAQGGVTAYDVRYQGYELDPVGGVYVTQTTDSYDSPTLGQICAENVFVVAFYDNMTTGAIEFTETLTDIQILTGEKTASAHGHSLAPITINRRALDRLRAAFEQSRAVRSGHLH
jgi:hypothetical protein